MIYYYFNYSNSYYFLIDLSTEQLLSFLGRGKAFFSHKVATISTMLLPNFFRETNKQSIVNNYKQFVGIFNIYI